MQDNSSDSTAPPVEGPPSDLLVSQECDTSLPALAVPFISGKNLTPRALEQYCQMKLVGCSQNTKRLCRTAVERFLRYVASRPDANLLHVYSEYAQMLHSTTAPHTYQRELGRVNHFLAWVKDMGHLDMMPNRLCRTPPARATRIKMSVITPDDYLRIKQACDAMGNSAAKELIITGYWTGLSLSDCCLLHWAAVDLDKMIIFTKRLKTNTEVEIPIVAGSEFHRYLSEAWKNRDDKAWPNDPARGVFFVNTMLAAGYHAKQKSRQSTLDNWIRKAFNKAGLRHHTFHDLRRTMATVLCSDGSVSVGAIMRIMGWTSPAMIEPYLLPGHGGLLAAFTDAMRRRDETANSIMHSGSVSPPQLRSIEHPTPALNAGEGDADTGER